MTAYAHPRAASDIVQSSLLGTGVTVADSYELCRRINRAHGRTYYFATQFLPRDRRHHVHALYAFARYADDLVDHAGLSLDIDERRHALDQWLASFFASLETGHSDDPVLLAVVRTVRELQISRADLDAFVRSMAMDFDTARYATHDDLHEYVYGSAAVIGTMMLPVLGATSAGARQPAMDLGIAFQLTNFLRDIAEDWERGRIYIPTEDLDLFEVTEADFAAGVATPQLRRLLAYEVGLVRALYRRAEDGWAHLPSGSRRCIRIAHHLYAEILDRIEAADYDVFTARASVPTRRKLAVAARETLRPSRPSV